MKSRRILLFVSRVLVLGLFAGLSACSHLPFRHQEDAPPRHDTTLETNPGMVGQRPNARGLAVEIKSSPDPVKLGETREINVTLVLHNNSKVTANLKFATSQTIEILLRDPDNGKVVTQWSTDRMFPTTSRYVVINAHERAEYNEPITTRDLHAGKTYNLEAYFVGYDQELRAQKPIIPQP